MKNDNDLQNVVEVFKNPDANAEAVTNAGLLFLLFLYGFCGKSLPSLNNIRYRCYIKLAFKTTSNIGLMPITTLQPPAPEAVLKIISCKCNKNCRGNCGCKKARLCSLLCLNCAGHCENIGVFIDDEDQEGDVEDTIVQDIFSQEPSNEEEQCMNDGLSHEEDLNQPGPSKCSL